MIDIEKTGLLVVVIFAIVTLSSCKKDNVPGLNSGLSNLKVYSDTTASGENASLKIAAGNDKLFMVYGSGSPFAFTGGSIFTLQHQAKIIGADFNGEVLWQNSIAVNLDVYDVVALNDGGCAIVSFNYWGNLDHTQKHIYLNWFDGNGNSTLADSVLLPASISADYYLWGVGGCRSPNGNLILYGTIYDLNDPVNPVKPYIGEYSFTGGWIWCKWYKLLQDATSETCYINSSVAMDNGYLFGIKATKDSPGSGSYVLLLKTNLFGDTLWTWKQQDDEGTSVGNSVVDFNGDIYFGYNTGAYQKSTSYISRIDVNGQFLNTSVFDNQANYFITSVKATNRGTVTALSNIFGTAMFSYADPIFPVTNTRLFESDAALNISANGQLQSQTADFFPVSCILPNNKTACFGLIQPKSRTYYKPALMILE